MKMNESNDKTYTFSDLVDAWRDARRWENAHKDIASHHGDRYRAFSEAFGADLGQVPDPAPPLPDWMRMWGESLDESASASDWGHFVYPFILKSEELAGGLDGPWAGYLEAPTAINNIYARYSPDVNASFGRACSETLAMCRELLAELFPAAAAKTVTAGDLRAAGFDPEREAPDSFDYF